ncbi:MAG TPA: hypothetical protein VG323_06385 [Thermoanaerobaculia bacterium]|nr:hypothetical protein [Thermoanaerobaculia bacterium]
MVSEYAIAGALALLFWSEPIPTYDLDVLVFLPETQGPIVSLYGLYRWAESRGYRSDKEHIIIEDLPVQFVPANSALADEAIETAAVVTYGSTAVRVVRPEYLVALYLEGSAATAKRRARAAVLRESGKVDETRLRDLAQRFKIPL